MSYSRRQLYAMGEPLGECVTRKEGGRIIYGGGDSTPAVQTQISDLPEWARGTAQKTLGMAEELTDISKNPYQAYGGQRTAQFSPLQKQAYGNAMGLNAGPQGFAQNIGAYMSPFMQNALPVKKVAASSMVVGIAPLRCRHKSLTSRSGRGAPRRKRWGWRKNLLTSVRTRIKPMVGSALLSSPRCKSKRTVTRWA